MPDFDPQALLAALAAESVDHVVIGGIAAVLHGSPRSTFDLDITFDTAADNLARLGRALIGLGATLRGAPTDLPFVPDARTLRRVEVLTLDTRAGSLDVLSRPAGAPSFATLRERADRYDIDGLQVLVAAIEDLITMKTAAGRPKDLADIAELDAILRLRREQDVSAARP